MINIEDEYKGLLSSVLHEGAPKDDRTGTGTRAVFGRILKHDMPLGFPLLTTKKVYFKHAVTELLWMLQGRTDMDYLHSHGLNYWDDDYKRSGRSDNTLGPIYGYQWRNFNGVDQIRKLVNDIKENPNSRRLMVSCWNPSDMDKMALPPCHYNFQIFINDGKMDLMWNQRSVDIFLGLPYDFAIYGLLLCMLAEGLGYKANRLIASLGDCHLYNNHHEQARELLARDNRKLPNVRVDFGLDILKGAGGFLRIPSHSMIKLENYDPHPAIKAPLSVGY
jgi:thymidylate synthase